MVRSPIAEAYLERLTDRDVLVLTSAAEHEQGPDRARHLLGSDPDRLERLLGSRQVFEAVFTDGSRGHELVGASPFLVFAVCVQRAVAELESATYVMDWIGPGRRAPVFDAARLREFTARGETRLFLAQLLASYTHVASGSVVTLTRRGLRRQRFSELDPVRLASLLDVVSDEERPGILRRLGDLALFLTGVFPDYVARRGFSEIEEGRLVRSGVYGPSARRPQLVGSRSVGRDQPGAVSLLDQLGRRWYRSASRLVPAPAPGDTSMLDVLADRFGEARRILGMITERFIFTERGRLFGMPAD